MTTKNTGRRAGQRTNRAAQNAGQNLPRILPEEKTQAVQHLIKLTNNLVQLGEREAQALAQNDMLAFAVIQDEKIIMAEHYAAASTEFRARLPEFRGLNAEVINRLSNTQTELGDITEQNNKAVEGVYERTKERTQKTLKEASKISREKRVEFDAVFANENADAGTSIAGA